MKKIFRWLGRRAKEPSTYAGLAIAATTLGLPGVGIVLGKAGTLVAAVVGGGLVAHQSGGDDAIDLVKEAGLDALAGAINGAVKRR